MPAVADIYAGQGVGIGWSAAVPQGLWKKIFSQISPTRPDSGAVGADMLDIAAASLREWTYLVVEHYTLVRSAASSTMGATRRSYGGPQAIARRPSR
ncbi:hypothetical protein ACH5A2_28695 [Streptomyces collinus]|uniref:hypothetical protein n=1 Tax=Streptomyces collinus TaxID=42684 RepID=UPI00378942E4